MSGGSLSPEAMGTFHRGYSISPQAADYFLALIVFLDEHRAYPKLGELAERLKTHPSAISRVERNLRQQGLLRGSRTRGGLRIASHLVLQQGPAALLHTAVVLSQQSKRNWWPADELLGRLVSVYSADRTPVPRREMFAAWLDELLQKGHLAIKGQYMGVNWERWEREKLLVGRLTELPGQVLLLPPAHVFSDEDPGRRLFRRQPMVGGEARPEEIVLSHAGAKDSKTFVVVPRTAYAVTLQQLEDGRWLLRVSVERDDGVEPGPRLVRLLRDGREIVKGWTTKRGLLRLSIPQDIVDCLREGVTVEVAGGEGQQNAEG